MAQRLTKCGCLCDDRLIYFSNADLLLFDLTAERKI